MSTQTKERAQTTAKPAQNQGDVAERKEPAPLTVFNKQLGDMESQIEILLPPEIDIKRFKRIVLTAVQKNPDLLEADRNSFFQACLEAAADGLLPDGREGAFVIFNTKVKWQGVDKWIKKVQWMPMIQGITKKILATGAVKEFRSRVVYEKDEFEVIYGDDDRIDHKPCLTANRGPIIAAYAILKKHDGGVEREVMTKEDLDQVRAASKQSDGPAWKEWESEMHRKSVTRRLAKRCVFDEGVQQVLERDDNQFDFDQGRAERSVPPTLIAPPAPKPEDFKQSRETAEDIEVEDDDAPDAGSEDDRTDAEKFVDTALALISLCVDPAALEEWWVEQEPVIEDLGLNNTDGHKQLRKAFAGRLTELAREPGEQG